MPPSSAFVIPSRNSLRVPPRSPPHLQFPWRLACGNCNSPTQHLFCQVHRQGRCEANRAAISREKHALTRGVDGWALIFVCSGQLASACVRACPSPSTVGAVSVCSGYVPRRCVDYLCFWWKKSCACDGTEASRVSPKPLAVASKLSSCRFPLRKRYSMRMISLRFT